MIDEIISRGWHHTFGWLRRPELDTRENGYVYEMPCGAIVVSHEGRHEHGMYLDAWREAKTGDTYLTCSPVPRVYAARKT